ncbi:Uncharacterised protein [Vibrio cholerae]|nr:Uncharacterised protein [Vibrio cholerae]
MEWAIFATLAGQFFSNIKAGNAGSRCSLAREQIGASVGRT